MYNPVSEFQQTRKPMKLHTALICIAACLISTLIGMSAAQVEAAFPERPVTIIVPFAAGGPSDTVARLIAVPMARALGQSVRVENVMGGGGTTAAIRAMRAAADGHTMVLGHLGTHAAASASYSDLPYDPVGDFEPIGMIARMPVVVVVRKDFPAQNLREFVAHIKEHPAKMADAGLGSVAFTTCLLFNSLSETKPKLTRFNGTGPAMDALVAGEIDYMCDQIVNVVPHLRAGSVKALVVGTPQRNAAVPDVPTVDEAGMPGFHACSWNGLFATKGTPKDVIAKINTALAAALEDPNTRKQLADLGAEVAEPGARSPEALAKLVQSEIARWSPLIKAASH